MDNESKNAIKPKICNSWLILSGLEPIPESIKKQCETQQVIDEIKPTPAPEKQAALDFGLTPRQRLKLTRFIKPRIQAGYSIQDIYQLMIAAGNFPIKDKCDITNMRMISSLTREIKEG